MLIVPPTEIRDLIFKTASFLANAPSSYVDRLRQQDEKKFSFLDPEHFYFEFFNQVKQGKIQPQQFAITSDEQGAEIAAATEAAIDEDVLEFFSDNNAFSRFQKYTEKNSVHELIEKLKLLYPAYKRQKKRQRRESVTGDSDSVKVIRDFSVFTLLRFNHGFLDSRKFLEFKRDGIEIDVDDLKTGRLLGGAQGQHSTALPRGFLKAVEKGEFVDLTKFKEARMAVEMEEEQEKEGAPGVIPGGTAVSASPPSAKLVRCPITGELIEDSKFESHLKGLLLDPQYAKEKAEMARRVSENSAVYSTETVALLKKFLA